MSRSKATPAQLNHLIEFMKAHRDCASGRGIGLEGKLELEQQWQKLKDTLNSLGGPVKTVDKWKQTWRDLRNGIKKKMIKHNKEHKVDCPGGTGNGSAQREIMSKIRYRRRLATRAGTEIFDSQILQFKKERLEVLKRQVAVDEKKLELKERRLLIEEAKLEAFERIASILENNFKK